MVIRPDIREFVDRLGRGPNGSLNYPDEVAELLQIVVQTGMIGEFEELIFLAKFINGMRHIFGRSDAETAGIEKLASEFRSGLEKAAVLLNKIIGRGENHFAEKFSAYVNLPETGNYDRLMDLISDLSRIKNWQIDGKPVPYENETSVFSGMEHTMKSKKESRLQSERLNILRVHVRNISVLALLFFIIFIYIDPPVTVIGWTMAGAIFVFLIYIAVQIFLTFRKS